MQVTSEQLGPCELELKIEVEPERVAQAYDQAYQKFARVTNVPGFRKGKAPRPILERYVPEESVRDEVRDSLVVHSYYEALDQEKLVPYSGPEVEVVTFEDGEPFVFKAKVPLPPKVELGDYKGIEVEKPPVAVTDEDIENELKYLQERRTTAEKVEDRGVRENDIIVAEVSSTLEGQEPTPAKRSLIQMGSNVPGFDDHVMDLKPGERRTFSLTYPVDYGDAELAGKTADFDVALESIRERKVPDLDDEFAKAVGGFETMAELREDIGKQAISVREQEAEKEVERKIIDQIVARSNICFPDMLLEHDVHHEMEEIQEEFKKRGLTLEQYLERTGKSEEEWLAEMKEALTRRIKAGLAMAEISDVEKIDVTDEDVEAEIDRTAADSNATRESVEAYVDTTGGRPALKNSMLNRKILDFLKSVSSIKYGAETGAEST